MSVLATSGTEYVAPEAAASRLPADIKQRILNAVVGIEYGSVEVVIHDRKVVQIECRERIRVGRGDSESKATKS